MFIVWFNTHNNLFRTYNPETQERLTYNINQFELMKGYEATDTALREFSKDLIQWRNEILNSKSLLHPFDYFDDTFILDNGNNYYKTHSNNIKLFIKRFINPIYKDFDPITIEEERSCSLCYNSGVIYSQPGIYETGRTYDYKMFYPRNMASNYFEIPTTKPKTGILQSIPKKFKYGIYNVVVRSDDPDFKKIFSFSKHNYYTHYTLNFVLSYLKQHPGTVELSAGTGKCLVYQNLIKGGSVFYMWYCRLLDLKNEFPKNKLVKALSSSAWGHIQSQNVIVKTEEEIDTAEGGLDIGFSKNPDDNEYYIKKLEQKEGAKLLYYLVNLKKGIYEFPLRLKPFLTSYCRVKIAETALPDIDDVVRIQIDSITYKNNIKKNIKYFILEQDKSGRIEVFNNKKPLKII